MSDTINNIRFNYSGDTTNLLAKSWVTDNTDTTKNTVIHEGEQITFLWRNVTYSINDGRTTTNGVFKVQVNEEGKPDAQPNFEVISGEQVMEIVYDEREDLLFAMFERSIGFFSQFSTAEENVEYVSEMEGTTTWSYVNSTTIGYENNIVELYVNSDVTTFPYGLFTGDTNLTSIIFDTYSITTIDGIFQGGQGAFVGCENLTSVTLPNTLISIGDYVFCYCTSLTSIIIPDSVTSIGNYAFSTTSLTSVIIPDSVTSIGDSTFNGCPSLTSIIIPDSVTSIGSSVFSECSALTSIIIPDSVTSIGNYAFNGCTSLTSIIIPDSVTSIGDSTFYGCTSLSSIIIPDSVTSIGGYTFGNASLTKFASMGEVPPTIKNYTFSSISDSAVLYVPQGYVSTYSGWATYFSDIVEGTPVTITASTSDGGTITSLGETTLFEGFDMQYLLLPFEGYEIETVLVDGADVTSQISNNTYTFEEVEGNHTISVKYRSTTPPTPTHSYGFNLSGMKNVDYKQQGVIILRN